MLEGRVELLEQFLPHHRALHRAVAHPSWRGRTLERLDALRELELNDAALDAAVSVAVRRLEIEVWPDEDGAVKHVRETARLRSEVRALVTDRLKLSETGALPFAVLLDLLRTAVEQPEGLPASEGGGGERVLLEARTSPFALFPWWCLLPLVTLWAGALPEVGLALMALVALVRLRGASTLRITPARLVWKPFFGRSRSLSLRELRSVRAVPELFTADLVLGMGALRRPLFMFSPAVSARAAGLIEIHRRLELGSNLQPRAHRVERVTCEATLMGSRRPMAGMALLRPGYVAFLYRKTGPKALDELAGYGFGRRRAELAVEEVSLELLVEQLALLPEDQFDPLLRRLAREHGALFPAPECQPVLEGDRLAVEDGAGQRLEGRVDGLQRPRARRLLDAWGARSSTELAAAG